MFTGRNTFPVGRYYRTFGKLSAPFPTFGSNEARSGPLSNRVGALLTWPAQEAMTIKSRVGISFTSTKKACTFKNMEIPSWNIQNTVDAARKEWNEDIFGNVKVPTDDSTNKTKLSLLYSSPLRI